MKSMRKSKPDWGDEVDEEGPSINKKSKENPQRLRMGKQQYQSEGVDPEPAVVRIPPYHYIHVIDQITNVTRVEIGPQTFVRKDNERVLTAPIEMVIVPPRHYCVIKNPVVREESGEISRDAIGQIKLFHADFEVRYLILFSSLIRIPFNYIYSRFAQDPFPLYPGEKLELGITPLRVVNAMTALQLRVTRDFVDNNVSRIAGDIYLFEGPGTYLPRKEVEVKCQINAEVILPNEALKLKAVRSTVDRDGKPRVAGEEWLIRRSGDYLPGAYEEVVEKCKATVNIKQNSNQYVKQNSQ